MNLTSTKFEHVSPHLRDILDTRTTHKEPSRPRSSENASSRCSSPWQPQCDDLRSRSGVHRGSDSAGFKMPHFFRNSWAIRGYLGHLFGHLGSLLRASWAIFMASWGLPRASASANVRARAKGERKHKRKRKRARLRTGATTCAPLLSGVQAQARK